MRPKLYQLKQELKVLAQRIRTEKRTNGWTWTAHRLGQEFRHKHIADCMLRGRSYEQCEQKTRQDNKANMDLVNKYIVDYMDVPDAA